MKIPLDQYRIFIGFPIFHFEREIILKAGEDRIVPKEDILQKGIFFPDSGCAAIHDGRNMTRGITI